MPVYLDKTNNRLYIKFSYKGETYTKRLPGGMGRRDAKKFEATWRSGLFFSGHGLKEQSNILFQDFLKEYFLPYSEENKKSFKLDATVCRAAIALFKNKMMRDIKPSDIESFKNVRLKTPVTRIANGFPRVIRARKPATVEREMTVLSKVFTIAVQNEFCDFNPCARVEKLSYDNRQTRVLSEADEAKFFAAFLSDWARDICLVSLYTGLRQADAIGLQRFQLDWERSEIRLVQGKTNALVVIPMVQLVKEILTRWLTGNTSEYVFPSPKTGLKGTSVKKAVAGAIKRSKVPRLTIRDLRRTAATRLLERGVSHLVIAKILGHGSLKMIGRYAQTDNLLHGAMQSLETAKSNVIKFKGRKAK